jgi:hypothetical protein
VTAAAGTARRRTPICERLIERENSFSVPDPGDHDDFGWLGSIYRGEPGTAWLSGTDGAEKAQNIRLGGSSRRDSHGGCWVEAGRESEVLDCEYPGRRVKQ